jgi:hypothetical protein
MTNFLRRKQIWLMAVLLALLGMFAGPWVVWQIERAWM